MVIGLLNRRLLKAQALPLTNLLPHPGPSNHSHDWTFGFGLHRESHCLSALVLNLSTKCWNMDFDDLRVRLKNASSRQEMEALFDEALRPKDFHELLGEVVGARTVDDLRECEDHFEKFFVPEASHGKFRAFAGQFSRVMFEWTLSRSLLDSGWSQEKLNSKRPHARSMMATWWEFIVKAFIVADMIDAEYGKGHCTQERFWPTWNKLSKDPELVVNVMKEITGTEQELHLRLMA